jgi:hypothetical protein
MTLRPCLDCGALVARASRCSGCEAGRERRRGSPSRRGYDSRHVAARLTLRDTLPGPCGYGCGTWLWPNGQWVAAHVVDGNPDAGWIASCRTCNQRAKGRRESLGRLLSDPVTCHEPGHITLRGFANILRPEDVKRFVG